MLKDLSDISEALDYDRWMNRRLDALAFGRLQGRTEDKARAAEVPVASVETADMAQTCHECSHVDYSYCDESATRMVSAEYRGSTQTATRRATSRPASTRAVRVCRGTRQAMPAHGMGVQVPGP